MSTRELDLPLEETPASRFLLWIIAALVYLTVLTLAVAAIADGALRTLERQPRVVTVALPPAEADVEDRQVGHALEVLRGTEGVRAARPVDEAELEELVESWLGAAPSEEGVPLPRLIDVTFDPERDPDLEALRARLHEVVADASIEIEELALARDDELARLLRVAGAVTGIVLLLGTVVVVVVVTRMSLDLHDETVDLLRLMGAPDSYVARQFELHALLHGLRGGLIGFAAALLTLLAVVYAGRVFEGVAGMALELRALDWVLLACVPVVTALLITASARLTALWSLARLR